MASIRRVLAAENGYLLNEVMSYRGRRVLAASYVVTGRNRLRVARFDNQPAAERYFCDEVRRAHGPRRP